MNDNNDLQTFSEGLWPGFCFIEVLAGRHGSWLI